MPRAPELTEHDVRMIASRDRLEAREDGAVLPSFSKSSLPAGPVAGQAIFVSDSAGGPTIAFFDGTGWRQITTTALS